jgi:hypothetical protein
MEKILLAIDAVNPDRNTLEFACFLSLLTKSKITGVFLENLLADERPLLKEMRGLTYVDWMVDKESTKYKVKSNLIEKNISFFKEACNRRGVNYRLHRNRGVPARELVEESRFADILVIDAETSFNKRYEGTPTDFARDILKKAECPVIIAPETFESIGEIVFTYDGSSSSVFAIKQFTYLFPQMFKKKVTIMQVNEAGEWQDRDKYKFKEWLKDHYSDLQFEAVKGKTNYKLFDYLFQRKNMFLVMGAYGRNPLSEFFKRSSADLLIRTITQPIFIAHL